MKRLWRCHVCNDIHFGNRPPEVCPTCGAKRAFVPSDLNEAMEIIGKDHRPIDDPAAIISAWKEFAEQSLTVRLTDRQDEIDLLSMGVIDNLSSKGQRYCPCRITTGDRTKDLNLICPCNFTRQQTYKEQGDCWCSLFIKRDKQ
jgi:ferredoxin-thioredoxin reductase catalytic chain